MNASRPAAERGILEHRYQAVTGIGGEQIQACTITRLWSPTMWKTCLLLILAGAVSASESSTAGVPRTASVNDGGVVIEGNAPQSAVRIVVKDDQGLRELGAMFPGYEKRPVADFALAMDPAYLIHFPQPDGSRITVKSDGKVWYVTSGSWPVAGDLAAFISARSTAKTR